MQVRANIKRVLILALTASLTYLAIEKTDGFRTTLIENSGPITRIDNSSYPIISDNFPREYAEELEKPFYYIGRGNEFFVFKSESGRCVLKFLNEKKVKENLLEKPLKPFLHSLKNRSNRVERRIHSYELASTLGKDETALIYLHLKPTDEKRVVTLVNKIGLKHKVYLGKTRYVIQKAAQPVYPKLYALTREDDSAEAKVLIENLVHELYKKPAIDAQPSDLSIDSNFGLVEDHVVKIDIGVYYPLCKEYSHAHANNEAEKLLQWFEKNAPTYLDFVKETIRRSR